MKRAAVRLAAIWSVAIWPALNFTAHNWNDIVADGAGAIAGVVLITLMMGALGHAFHVRMSRRNAGAFAVVLFALAVCLFFGYSLIHDASASLLARLDLGIAPSLIWLLFSVILAAAVFRSRKVEGLQAAATVFCFSAAVLALGQLCIVAMRGSDIRLEAPVSRSDPRQQHAQPKLAGVNVYYLLLDGYAGQSGLREFAGFDNFGFIEEMTRRGFVDAANIGAAGVHSNYLITQQTLGSIFALDYSLTENPKTWREPWRLFPNIVNGAQVPPLIREFESSGYTVWQTFNTWIGCSGRNMRCIGGQGSLDFDYMTMAFVAPTPLGRAVTLLLGRRIDGLVSIATHLPALRASKQSNFVFVHSLLTHPPIYLDALCERRNLDQSDIDGRNSAAYVGAVKCANFKLIRLVDRILSDDPSAIIVVQSDHGSAFTVDWELPMSDWPESFIRERGSFINLIRAPAACAEWLDRSIAQVNTARFVLGCARGRAPQYLPERTFLSSYSKTGGNYVIVPMNRRGVQPN